MDAIRAIRGAETPAQDGHGAQELKPNLDREAAAVVDRVTLSEGARRGSPSGVLTRTERVRQDPEQHAELLDLRETDRRLKAEDAIEDIDAELESIPRYQYDQGPDGQFYAVDHGNSFESDDASTPAIAAAYAQSTGLAGAPGGTETAGFSATA